MDLTHDWKALNEILFHGQAMSKGASSVVLVEDEGKVIDGVVSNGKAFDDIGLEKASANKDALDSLAAKYGTDQVMVLSKKHIDQYVIEATTLGTNYFQQIQTLREKIGNETKANAAKGAIISRRHFLLDLFGQKLKRFLPRRFNVLLFVDSRESMPAGMAGSGPFQYKALLLSYSGGQLDQFFEPDFSSLHENRLRNWQQESDTIGQYLENRYILPCYGVYMFEEDWERCLGASADKGKPWRQFVRYHDDGRAAVYPKNTLSKALLATQRLMVYFGRL